MTKQGLMECDGQVTHVYPGGLLSVTLDNNIEMLAKVCRNVCCHGRRVALDDRVRVGVSPYDLTRGLIVFCYAHRSNLAQHEQSCRL